MEKCLWSVQNLPILNVRSTKLDLMFPDIRAYSSTVKWQIVFEGEDESGEVTSVSFIKGEVHFLVNSICKKGEKWANR